MKISFRMHRIAFVVLIAFSATLLLTMCNQVPPVTIEDRLGQWAGDMRSNKSNVWTHFHDDTGQKNALKNYTLALSTEFGNDTDYTLSSIIINGTSVNATITYSSSAGPQAISFTMKEKEPKVWYILTMTYAAHTWN
jgi:hypothetical protein